MRRFTTAAAALTVTAALAACDRGQHGSGTQTAAAKPAGSTLTNFPSRRAGLWEQTTAMDGRPLGPAGKTRLCLDAATDARLSLTGRRAAGAACEKPVVNRLPGGGVQFVSSCSMGAAGRVTTTGTVSGDFSTSYAVHSQTEVTGAPLAPMNGRHVIDVTARYLGPCPADMTPGDMVGGGGVKGNINRLGRGFQGPPSAPG